MTESRGAAPRAPLSSRSEVTTRTDEFVVVPLRHPWRYLSGLVVLVALGLVVWSLFTNPNLDVATIGHYLFEPYIIKGVGVTLMLTAVSMVLGVALSVLLAVMRLSENRVLSGVAWLYIWFFRGTPLLVQIIFWGFLGALYPRVVIGIPFTDITFFEQVTSVLIPATVAAIIALTLNEAAYNAEIVRAGLISVDVGQSEAAAALGLSGRQAMRTIVLPQAMRVIVPPLGNQTISMLKATSLVAIVGGQELLTAVQSIYSNNFKVMPLLAVAAIWYLALVSVLSVGQHFLERRYGKAGVAPARPGPLRRLFVSEGGPA